MIPTAPENRAQPPEALTDRQREVYAEMVRYGKFAGEAPSVRFLARRLGLHWTTVQQHIEAIHHKGWLPAPRPWLHRG